MNPLLIALIGACMIRCLWIWFVFCVRCVQFTHWFYELSVYGFTP